MFVIHSSTPLQQQQLSLGINSKTTSKVSWIYCINDKNIVIGCIAYSKAFMGDIADAEERGERIQTPGYRYFLNIVNNEQNCYGYKDFLENKDVFTNFWNTNKTSKKGWTYEGVHTKRQECMNLMMYSSSFLDRNYNYALFIVFNGQTIDQYE